MDVTTELQPAPGTETIQRCPEPGCDATMAAPGRFIEHHDDGSHTFEPARLVPIRLLTSIHGGGAVDGDVDAIIEVDEATAAIWADGERAERVIFAGPPEVAVPEVVTAPVPTPEAPVPPAVVPDPPAPVPEASASGRTRSRNRTGR